MVLDAGDASEGSAALSWNAAAADVVTLVVTLARAGGLAAPDVILVANAPALAFASGRATAPLQDVCREPAMGSGGSAPAPARRCCSAAAGAATAAADDDVMPRGGRTPSPPWRPADRRRNATRRSSMTGTRFGGTPWISSPGPNSTVPRGCNALPRRSAQAAPTSVEK